MITSYLNELIAGMLLTGHHTLLSISSDIKQYSPLQVLTALNEMKRDECVVYNNENMEGVYAFYITEKGINKYVR